MADDARPDLEALLIESRTVRDHLDEFAVRAAEHLPPGTQCSIALRHRGRDRLAASSGPDPASCDEAEFRSGEGPCLTSMDHLKVVVVPDVGVGSEWPAWRSQTTAVGFRSSAAVPAHVADGAEIALNLYSDRLDPWDADALTRADAYAQRIARTVQLCLQVAELTDQVRDLEQAVAARDVINRAVGVVMATNACTADEALAILRSASTNRNIDMAEVASALVRGLTGHDPRSQEPPEDDGRPHDD
ncbi:GAF and ANTAR domain-containing protein [Cellulomonas aerilata]|uniref:Transcriptional regulator n=1 Tax=Cellulomonas aerilata TaxID=515326 RepID=A0A512D7X1_9CELL|nr:GAF and ANTAR domain-containing protein [Cellulomonas aerilata]GEO32576.1 transcriptional regulator [Cellulomonas aerilata]